MDLLYVGLDIGGTKCAVVYGESPLALRGRAVVQTGGPEETLSALFAALPPLAGAVRAVGISCGGPLDEGRGVILSPPNLPRWHGFPIADHCRRAFGVPAYLRNDANACALAEWQYGAGVGTENMIFLTFGTGMGAGLILGGRLYGGTNGNAGEVGHVRMASEGPVGFGKAGSFEGFCSGGGIARMGASLARRALAEGAVLPYARNESEISALTAATLAEYARKGEHVAQEVFRMSGEMLGRGLAILADLLNPEVIVIGSIYARCEDLLRGPMERTLHEEGLAESLSAMRVVPAALGEGIGDAAAMAVAIVGEREREETK